jgi:hypothetical protein
MQSNSVPDKNNRNAISLVIVFVVSVFLSAALLFSVQPMFTKMVLPLLGGAANVWNTAMVFFQAMLLLGYVYAHLISTYLSLKMQIIVHTAVMAVGIAFLPLDIFGGWTPPETGAHAFWLIGLFSVSVGVPFFAISANAPLLQRWFSYTDHNNAKDPYFLYAASNAGSLLSLCLYPLYFEPTLRLSEQTDLWMKGYWLLIAALIVCGVFAFLRIAPTAKTEQIADKTKKKPIANTTRLFWIGLAFIPSSLMLGVTSHITYNIASAPFLWIIPLSLYLLTFIIVFASKPIVSASQIRWLFPWVIIVAIIGGFGMRPWHLLSIGLSLLCYFIIALLCHSRLAEQRPAASKLTEFYILMSVGGVLGGIFNALVAPLIFNGIYEYVIVLLLAQIAVPRAGEKGRRRTKIWATLIFSSIAGFLIFKYLKTFELNIQLTLFLCGVPAFIAVMLLQANRKFLAPNLAVLIAFSLFLPLQFSFEGKNVVFQDRSFFGVLRVREIIDQDFGAVHYFSHGDTDHNIQFRAPDLQRIPLAYYSQGNTFNIALDAARAEHSAAHVAVIGLGAGAMACYAKPDETWTYYEIDPAVVKMAKNTDLFSYLGECTDNPTILLGDARMTIAQLTPNSQNLIMVDAFSSDAIPVHLVTKEALELYRSKLKSDGFVFFHTSNRMMDITSVVVKLAQDAGLTALVLSPTDYNKGEYGRYYRRSYGVLIGRDQDISPIVHTIPHLEDYRPNERVGVWTDDYSNILNTIWARAENKRNSKSDDQVDASK